MTAEVFSIIDGRPITTTEELVVLEVAASNEPAATADASMARSFLALAALVAEQQ